MGMYSAAGAGACSDCPAGQFSPTTGLAKQSQATPCLVCPAGSVAVKEGETYAVQTLSEAAVSCDAW